MMILFFEYDLDSVEINKRVKYLRERFFVQK